MGLLGPSRVVWRVAGSRYVSPVASDVLLRSRRLTSFRDSCRLVATAQRIRPANGVGPVDTSAFLSSQSVVNALSSTFGSHIHFLLSRRSRLDLTPHRKAPDGTLSDKLRTVEKTLSLVLQSVNAGGVPDPAALQQLQTSLAEGIAADKSKSSAARVTKPQSPESNSDPDLAVSDPRPPTAKRARRDTAASGSSSIAFPSDPNPNEIIHSPFLPNTSLSPHIGNNPLFDLTPRSQDSLPLRRPSPTTSGSLSILADASLAAQMDGRTSLTGLDPTFTLSRVTEALQAEGDEEGEQTKTPAVLSKGIVTPEMAVSMFRMCVAALLIYITDDC